MESEERVPCGGENGERGWSGKALLRRSHLSGALRREPGGGDLGKSILVKGNSPCKCPEAGAGLDC